MGNTWKKFPSRKVHNRLIFLLILSLAYLRSILDSQSFRQSCWWYHTHQDTAMNVKTSYAPLSKHNQFRARKTLLVTQNLQKHEIRAFLCLKSIVIFNWKCHSSSNWICFNFIIWDEIILMQIWFSLAKHRCPLTLMSWIHGIPVGSFVWETLPGRYLTMRISY